MENNMDIKDPVIYTKENIKLLKTVPVLDTGQIYIYVMFNSSGNIKIGKTTNIQQRLISLSGSNGGGYKINALYCSPPTWIPTIEETCHNHYHFARIKGTEWFDGEKVNFKDVVEYVNGMFYTDSFKICDELRKKINEKKVITINDNKGN